MENPLETGDISVELERVGRCSGVFTQRTIDACNQAASLLRRLRPILFSNDSDEGKVQQLRVMLKDQGDG